MNVPVCQTCYAIYRVMDEARQQVILHNRETVAADGEVDYPQKPLLSDEVLRESMHLRRPRSATATSTLPRSSSEGSLRTKGLQRPSSAHEVRSQVRRIKGVLRELAATTSDLLTDEVREVFQPRWRPPSSRRGGMKIGRALNSNTNSPLHHSSLLRLRLSRAINYGSTRDLPNTDANSPVVFNEDPPAEDSAMTHVMSKRISSMLALVQDSLEIAPRRDPSELEAALYMQGAHAL